MCDLEEEHRHIGKVHVLPPSILEMLNLDEGTLMNVELNTSVYPPGFDFTIEHPSMPPTREGWTLTTIEHDREAPIHTDD